MLQLAKWPIINWWCVIYLEQRKGSDTIIGDQISDIYFGLVGWFFLAFRSLCTATVLLSSTVLCQESGQRPAATISAVSLKCRNNQIKSRLKVIFWNDKLSISETILWPDKVYFPRFNTRVCIYITTASNQKALKKLINDKVWVAVCTIAQHSALHCGSSLGEIIFGVIIVK